MTEFDLSLIALVLLVCLVGLGFKYLDQRQKAARVQKELRRAKEEAALNDTEWNWDWPEREAV